MKNIKKYIITLLITLIIILLLYPLKIYMKYGNIVGHENINKCGIIIDKRTPSIKNDNKCKVINTFIIENNNEISEVKVSIKTFYKYKINDKYCYTVEISKLKLFNEILSLFIVTVDVLIIILIISIFLTILMNYITQ